MSRRPPRSTRTDTLVPYTTLFRSGTASLLLGNGERVSLNLKSMSWASKYLSEHSRGPAPKRVDQVLTVGDVVRVIADGDRSEEHTSELQSLMRISYAVFCLKQKQTRQAKCKSSEHDTDISTH